MNDSTILGRDRDSDREIVLLVAMEICHCQLNASWFDIVRMRWPATSQKSMSVYQFCYLNDRNQIISYVTFTMFARFASTNKYIFLYCSLALSLSFSFLRPFCYYLFSKTVNVYFIRMASILQIHIRIVKWKCLLCTCSPRLALTLYAELNIGRKFCNIPPLERMNGWDVYTKFTFSGFEVSFVFAYLKTSSSLQIFT